jgi:hypothetical protein
MLNNYLNLPGREYLLPGPVMRFLQLINKRAEPYPLLTAMKPSPAGCSENITEQVP